MSWKTVALGDVCEMYQPKTITSKELVLDGEYFVYGANGIIGKYSSFNHEKAQLVIGCRGSVGSVHMTKPKSWITGNAMVVHPKFDDIDLRFLEYFFRGAVDLSKAITGAAQPQITRTSLGPINFSYPSISTQHKIVAKLDTIFAEIDKATAAAEANAKNAEALFQSYLDKLFEKDETVYKKVNIKDVCKIGDGNHSSKYPKKDEMVESGVPFIRSTNIVNGVLSDKDLVYLTEAKHKELKKGHLKSGDVLITNRGEIGKVAIVDERFDNANLNSQIAWLRCHPTLINQYLLFFLMSANMKSFYSDTKTGAALQQLPIGKIEKIQVPLPSIDAQIMRCSEFLNVQQKSLFAISCYKNKIYQLTQLKKSILTKAFNGELVKE